MSRRFRGGFVHKVDGKGRVSVPSSFRRTIISGDPDSDGGKAKVVLTWGRDDLNCIEGYTVDGIEDVYDEIEALDRYSEERELLEMMINGCSDEFDVDDNGRMGLKDLRDKIGITGEAMFVGLGAKFQIWVPEEYEALMAKKKAEFGGNPLHLLKGSRHKDGARDA